MLIAENTQHTISQKAATHLSALDAAKGLDVYVDSENELRANHNLKFYGLPFLNLHYKMTDKQSSIKNGAGTGAYVIPLYR